MNHPSLASASTSPRFLLELVALCGLALSGPACTSSAGKRGDDALKEKPANTREFEEEELAQFLKTRNFDMFGGVISSRYVELDGVSPRELLVEVQCVDESCIGDFYTIQGSSYFLYSLAESLENPRLLTPRPISIGPDGSVQVVDINGDKQKDLVLSAQGKDGTRSLKIYSLLGKLLSSRFDGALPYGAVSSLVMDLDGDGSMEIVTIQQGHDTGNYGVEGVGVDDIGVEFYGHFSHHAPNLLADLKVQTWQVSHGSLNLKSIASQDGLKKGFEAMRANPETDIMDLARGMIVMRHFGQTISESKPLLAHLMQAYDERIASGRTFDISASTQIGPYGYPEDIYGNELPIDEFASASSSDLYILLAALNMPGQDAVATWSSEHLSRANTFDEIRAYIELSLECSSEQKRESIAVSTLDRAFNTLLVEGFNSPNFYNLAYYQPGVQVMDSVQRQFFIATALLDPGLTFKDRDASIKRFLDRSIESSIMMQTLLPQYPFSHVLTPYLLEMDLSALPSELISVLLGQILPSYIAMAQQSGIPGLEQDKKDKLVASLNRIMVTSPDRRDEVLYFISNHFQHPAFAESIAMMMSELRMKFESGRATQADRDKLYNVAMLLPVAMPALSTKEREWWTNYVYRQGMGYSIDSKLAEGCYNLAAQSEAQIDLILSHMETLPPESTLAVMCLPYMLGIYEESASPLNAAQQARLPAIIDSRLQPGGDEYQLQQFLMTLESYPGLAEFAPSLWRVVRKRKGPVDTARYQALVMLGKLGDHEAMKELRKTSETIFLDPKLREKNPYMNDYFFVEALARQRSPALLALMFELAEDKRVLSGSCTVLRDYIQGYGQGEALTDVQQVQAKKLCGGEGVRSAPSPEPFEGIGVEVPEETISAPVTL